MLHGERLASLRRCSTCECIKDRRDFPRGGDQCRSCKRKGWVPPDYLEAQPKTPRSKWGPPPWRYPIGVHQQRLLRRAQRGRCAICQKETERLRVDHCHVTHWVRGLLCVECNAGLGFFRDNTTRLQAAITYLDAAQKPN
mgnify:FL=1